MLQLDRIDPIGGDLVMHVETIDIKWELIWPICLPQESITMNINVSTSIEDGLILWFGEDRTGGYYSQDAFLSLGGDK